VNLKDLWFVILILIFVAALTTLAAVAVDI